MQALEYWKTVTTDHAGFLDSIVALLSESGVRYCVIGGQGVNAYVEPGVTTARPASNPPRNGNAIGASWTRWACPRPWTD